MIPRNIFKTVLLSAFFAALAFGQNGLYAATSVSDVGSDIKNDSGTLEEVVVTARKRTESLLDTPIAITALSKDTLERYAVQDYQSVAELVPSLLVAVGAGATGASIALRGITTGDSDASFSQAISTAIDGVQLSKGLSLQEGLFDMQQIEVLKGPQALFFGKNSPGGVINIRTVDPTEELSGFARVQDELYASDKLVSGAVSGKIADGLTARFAIQGSWLAGYNSNQIVPNDSSPFGVQPNSNRAPAGDEQIARLTLHYTIGSNFDVRAKIQYYDDHDTGRQSNVQLYACPPTNPYNFFLTTVDCIPNETNALTKLSAASIAAAGLPASDFFGSNQFSDIHSLLTSVAANYKFADEKLTLASITGYYDTRNKSQLDATFSGVYASLPSANVDDYYSLSEELRLQSNFHWYLDFMTGFLYQHEDEFTYTADALTLTPFFGFPFAIPIPPFIHNFKTQTYSPFAQLQFHLPHQFELSVGERWTEEKKTGDQLSSNPAPCPGLPNNSCNQYGLETVFHNLSSDFTLSYKPDPNLNFYASYREGYKSGGFSASVFMATSLSQLEYKPETAHGYEIGAKARLFEGTLSIDADAFHYTYDDLQVSYHSPGSTVIVITNAAEALTQGVELDSAWKPRFAAGLTLRAAITYVDAKYLSYLSTCYADQSPAQGCVPDALGVPTQNLAGKQMQDAPEWTGNIGFDYHAPLPGTQINYGLAMDAIFSSKYQSYVLYDPRAEQSSSTTINANVRVYSANWNVALIGRNLTNEIRATQSDISTFSTIVGAGHPSDLIGWFTPPRALLLQLTWNF
jgi:iron complex outermembrane recepter protein